LAIANALRLEAARRRPSRSGVSFGQICTAHAHKLLLSMFRSNSAFHCHRHSFQRPEFIKEQTFGDQTTFSRCDLDLRPFEYIGCHVIKLCTKFERNPISATELLMI